ncbi:Bug family tripartite tricarboxylate transporter substrate binding protein [Marinobacterium sedimentorum]|uniref:Bug family tripartite tricarboxylate transporter substrate binding protein n=1 Tax=Marinobacterium sedimentorum TaxID=2927804 RepID=UPI0020C736D2|nr:tripartite tricarboxylate transporter substrate binding protein [Marinobacterium sedimentorum]MCP8687595.1 tripartite tricarboxylate transporter substrate binding protein [Marinobacterium sedimentorum]
MSRKTILGVITAALLLSGHSFAQYPEQNLQGIIQWGAGGETDRVSRTISKLVEPYLDTEIVLVNQPGGSGVIATTFVDSRPSDGYTLLFGAENPQLYGVLGLSKLDYRDFYPVNIMSRNVGVILARKDAPWDSFEALVAEAKAHPDSIKMGTNGPGSLPFVIDSMMQSITGYDVRSVPFDGSGPGMTALLGGHVDFMPFGLSAAKEYIRSGQVKALAFITDEKVAGFETIPPITDAYPEFKKFLPWGSFFGVFVKRDTPKEIRDNLESAFHNATQSPEFQAFVENSGGISVDLSGADAEQFLSHWQSITAWLLHDSGVTKASPESFGIPRL